MLLLLLSTTALAAPVPYGRVVETLRDITFRRVPSREWRQATNNLALIPWDLLSTGERSWGVVHPRGGTRYRLRDLTTIEVVETNGQAQAFLRAGAVYYANQERRTHDPILTRDAVIHPQGTEFLIETSETGTHVVMFDGQALITNAHGSLTIIQQQAARIEPNQAPRTARIESLNLVQWWLYYPVVLNPDDLLLDAADLQALGPVLEAYRLGNIPVALTRFPDLDANPPAPASEARLTLLAALQLSAGSVRQAQEILEGLQEDTPGRRALLGLVAAVQGEPTPDAMPPTTSSEWLALSYQKQSKRDLPAAREAARQAVELAPEFGFAQTRLAELEFSFGRTRQAMAVLRQGLVQSAQNAQALSMLGFLMADAHRHAAARAAFDEAIRIDPALGNARLGRGLLRLHLGDREGGLDDLQEAALLEPRRALLHAYLGKGFQQAGLVEAAGAELEYAARLDPADPTPPLYAAHLSFQENRINDAIDELETSLALNDNRAVYRSGLLLDEDAAMRSANLARLYQNAGMEDVALRQAARGIDQDYGGFGSHLYLANSYLELLDPGRVTLRYETAANTEYLLANLLAPGGAGTLSPALSQQEYTRLFDRDSAGVVSTTDYLSRGAWREQGAVYANVGRTSASYDALYLTDPGQRHNSDLDLLAQSVRFRQQIGPSDHLFGQALWSHSEGGDLAPRYDPNQINRGVRVEETQEPIALAGYRHEWSPGQETLVLGAYGRDRLEVDNPQQDILLIQEAGGVPTFAAIDSLSQQYRSTQELFSGEMQQIFEGERFSLLAGLRGQGGTFDQNNAHQANAQSAFASTNYAGLQGDFDNDFQRATAYAYGSWRPVQSFTLQAGLSYDHLEYPENFRYAPLSDEENTADLLGPKAGLVWQVTSRTTAHAAYSRFLTGAGIDQSIRLEPTQVAGINQAFRSVIPDAVTGSNAGEEADMLGVLLDHRLPTRTYLGAWATLLQSEVDRGFGTYVLRNGALPAVPGQATQRLDYEEFALGGTVSQLVGQEWSFGVSYELTHAELEIRYPDLPDTLTVLNAPPLDQDANAWLHEVRLFGVFNHPSGFFARAETLWIQQSNQGDTAGMPGDDFWQFNLLGGIRMFQRRAEVTMGILNLADQDYRLSPLTLHPNLPRERTFFTRLRLGW